MRNTQVISKRQIAAIIVPIALLLSLGVGQYVLQATDPGTTTKQSSEPVNVAVQKDVVSYRADGKTTALAQLEALNDTIETKTTEFGTYVDAINGFKGGTDGKYWSFYVDGKMAQVGADALTPTADQLIEWKFQKL